MKRKTKKERKLKASKLVRDPKTGLLVTKSSPGVRISSAQVRAAMKALP